MLVTMSWILKSRHVVVDSVRVNLRGRAASTGTCTQRPSQPPCELRGLPRLCSTNACSASRLESETTWGRVAHSEGVNGVLAPRDLSLPRCEQ